MCSSSLFSSYFHLVLVRLPLVPPCCYDGPSLSFCGGWLRTNRIPTVPTVPALVWRVPIKVLMQLQRATPLALTLRHPLRDAISPLPTTRMILYSTTVLSYLLLLLLLTTLSLGKGSFFSLLLLHASRAPSQFGAQADRCGFLEKPACHHHRPSSPSPPQAGSSHHLRPRGATRPVPFPQQLKSSVPRQRRNSSGPDRRCPCCDSDQPLSCGGLVKVLV